ncbi:cartilage oligomeric matrix protein-like isoform X1 [Culex pipiens pallens]|uniref:cartilage oligomeric matrix protein-like isoform X1 n=1 Tax=Culex pipiens pallens TaxID=42434 RepID=UPI001954C79E|nr:cartilage oligomeric matrix protein-like isoform X1 [Culex pipiens pallens]XP_052565331.1 cartilage oligomeric matrix protein-like isoform X1 [Culex pipiens pallens]XP_052565332.1 cartilage oligomeric matrix protein-like isoform X1 [Culex pipiens pallens]
MMLFATFLLLITSPVSQSSEARCGQADLIYGEVTLLRDLLHRCARCPRIASEASCISDSTPCEPPRKLCSNNPCFPDVTCEESDHYPFFSCGDCPQGYRGDGRNCTARDPCGEGPCFRGVSCTWVDKVPFFECGDCPPGFEGDGRSCSPEDVCGDEPCFPSVNCSWTERDPFYECGPCPTGFVGDGMTCSRNPCLENSCYGGVNCQMVPSEPYFKCGDCPVGLAGDGIFCAKDSDADGYPDGADNCPRHPNSGQEDADNDGRGDACEEDVDADGVGNLADNCRYVSNPAQEDSDGDKIGDACDNCAKVSNRKQTDVDGDGRGNECDNDIDGDGLVNGRDNCPFVYNPEQEDDDGDGVGNGCDNCRVKHNPFQEDSDGNEVGDACSSEVDSDGDGFQDDLDNCPLVENCAQLDTDGDGIGDACDEDRDNDGVLNGLDNCELIPNAGQEDVNRNGIGDRCENDLDGDSIVDWKDNCPLNGAIKQADLRNFTTLSLDPKGTSQDDPYWEIRNQGTEIYQSLNSDPGLAVGLDKLEGLDFEGTFFVEPDPKFVDDDFIGFVFGFVNARLFYFVSWKAGAQQYWDKWPFVAKATPGILLKLVNSRTGPGEMLRNSLWHDASVEGQTKLLWQDPEKKAWRFSTAYRWKVLHRPRIGLIRVQLYQGDRLEADSGNVFEGTIKGGRLGIYTFSQAFVTWSNLKYKCNGKRFLRFFSLVVLILLSTDGVPRDIFNQLDPSIKQNNNVTVVEESWL